jgi:hypothetical protein
MRRGVGLRLAAGLVALAMCGCSAVRHELNSYPGEVYCTPPPPGTPRYRLRHFVVKDAHVQLVSLIPIASPDLDDALRRANPEHRPIYNLRIAYDWEWYDYLNFAIGQVLYGLYDTFTVQAEGDILEPDPAKRR